MVRSMRSVSRVPNFIAGLTWVVPPDNVNSQSSISAPISKVLAVCVGLLLALAAEAIATTAIVINELHIDEADKTRRGEFIELHNNSDDAVDVSGWFFSSGINQAGAAPGDPPADFVIPNGTSIAARGYLVIAQDPAEILALFGYSGAIGPWVGKLSNKGETVTLNDSLGVVVDEVDYGHGWPWPTVGDPPSPSMELLHPDLDNDLGGQLEVLWQYPQQQPRPSRLYFTCRHCLALSQRLHLSGGRWRREKLDGERL